MSIFVHFMSDSMFRATGGDIAYIRDEVELKEVLTNGPATKYVYTARIRTDDLEVAYAATQNIEESWIDGDLVKFSKGRNLRSSMMGDIFIRYEGETAVAYMVASFGFKKLPLNDAEVRKMIEE